MMDICRGWRLDAIWHVDYSLWTALFSQGKVFFFFLIKRFPQWAELDVSWQQMILSASDHRHGGLWSLYCNVVPRCKAGLHKTFLIISSPIDLRNLLVSVILIISIKEKQLLLPRPSWLGKVSISFWVDPRKSQLWSESWAAEDKQVPEPSS